MYPLRSYTLASPQAARTYAGTHWDRPKVSLPKFGIKVHGGWLQTTPVDPRMALVSCALARCSPLI